jgi:dTDP-4-amino-4,6-dideoxygalactose transaminase
MRKDFIPEQQIGVGGVVLGPAEKHYLNEVIESSRLSYGPFTRRLEKEFANEHGVRYGIFLNSGTSALHIALAVLKDRYGWQDEDEVIVPATTFVATANIVLHNNMCPVFVDVEQDTYNINPSLIEAKITAKTKAIIPVHLFGLPADMEPILQIAAKYNLKIIEDSCETMFSTYKGKKVGSFGEIGCFSTYIAHFLVTGIGGFCITDDPELAVSLRSLMNHGRDSIYIAIDDDRTDDEGKFNEIIEKRFSFIKLGHSFRATELEAAIGLGQFEQRFNIINRRREIASYYNKRLGKYQDLIQLPRIPADRDHNFMMYPLVLKNRHKREMVNFLEHRKIETRDMLPLINQPIYSSYFKAPATDFPVSTWLVNSGFYIGSHQYLTDEEIEYVADTVIRYLEGGR